MVGDDAAALGLSLIKQLYSSCYKRDRALRLLLKSWLPPQPNLTDDMMNKLCKGLFYFFWNTDFQSRDGLIDGLSSLLLRLQNSSLSLHYFSSFLLTMRREWTAIDGLRLEQFYLFVRRFLHYSFAFLKIHSWDLDLTSRLISLLEDACFLVKQDNFGVSYHIASVFLEELRPFLPLRPEVLEIVFKPFISVMGSLPDYVLLWKIRSNMFDELLKMGNKLLEVKKLGDDNEVHDNDDDVVVLGTIALTMGFSSKFSELCSSVYCWEGNKEVLFVLYDQFLKLEKDAAEVGLDINDAVEDVPSAFELPKTKVNDAAEVGLDINDAVEDVPSAFELPKTKVNGTVSKKGKKAKSGTDYLLKMIDSQISVGLPLKTMTKLEKDAAEVGLDINDAAEVGLDINDAVEDVPSAFELPKTKVNGTVSKKGKKAKSGTNYCDDGYLSKMIASQISVGLPLKTMTKKGKKAKSKMIASQISVGLEKPLNDKKKITSRRMRQKVSFSDFKPKINDLTSRHIGYINPDLLFFDDGTLRPGVGRHLFSGRVRRVAQPKCPDYVVL